METNINDPKVFTKKPIKKKVTKPAATNNKPKNIQPKPAPVVKNVPKEKELTEQYQYKGEGELIMDKPNEPVTLVQNIEPVIFSNRETFQKLASERKDFTLKYNGSVIYDTTGKYEKLSSELSFEEDGFILYGKKYSYDGLNFKFKK